MTRFYRSRFLPMLLIVIIFPSQLWAQTNTIEPDPADVESLDAILTAVYDVISGPIGEARDWDRMRSLFIPDAQLIPTVAHPENGVAPVIWSVEDYISRSGPMLEQVGFTETEISRHVDRYGDIAQVFSTYEGKLTQNGTDRVLRGINSFQLMKDNSRWWIVSIFWQQAGPDVPIPDVYLPASEQ